MGQIRTRECEKIDAILAEMCDDAQIETRKDTYSEDYIVWVTVNESVHPIRLTIEEYANGAWKENLRQAIALLHIPDCTA